MRSERRYETPHSPIVNALDGYVLGLSGGVDSSLVAALTRNAVGKDKLMCIIMPIDSNPNDLIDAEIMVDFLQNKLFGKIPERYTSAEGRIVLKK